jgi:hypothetical protein
LTLVRVVNITSVVGLKEYSELARGGKFRGLQEVEADEMDRRKGSRDPVKNIQSLRSTVQELSVFVKPTFNAAIPVHHVKLFV